MCVREKRQSSDKGRNALLFFETVFIAALIATSSFNRSAAAFQNMCFRK